MAQGQGMQVSGSGSCPSSNIKYPEYKSPGQKVKKCLNSLERCPEWEKVFLFTMESQIEKAIEVTEMQLTIINWLYCRSIECTDTRE